MRSQMALLLVTTVLSAVVVQHMAAAIEQERGYDFCSGIHYKYTPPPRGTPPPPLVIKGNRLVNAQSGQAVAIRGLNWFGFNVGQNMVDGLWAGGKATATDFALIVYQLRLLGYNAVRLPFRWSDLNSPASSLDKDCAPVSVNELKQRLISPAVASKYLGQSLPGNVAAIKNSRAGACNTYIPNTNVWERLLWTTQVFISQGFYVALDYQPMGSEQQAMKVSTFVEPWTKLWKMVACASNFQSDMANRVFVDPMNEPDSMQIGWEPKDGRPGARELYLNLADAIWKLTPNKALFFFEGTGQNMFGLNWGNGFITDKKIIASRGLTDANPFFTQLAAKPYRGASIMTPHVYPPSITKATYLGKALWDQCRTAFGYLQTKGYCIGGKCNVYPVLIGETGTAFETSDDKQWMHDFFEFVNSFGDAVDYNPVPLNGWLWWAYNENSGDTGGIVHNGWQDIFWEKVNFHIARMGLRPWYLRKAATS